MDEGMSDRIKIGGAPVATNTSGQSTDVPLGFRAYHGSSANFTRFDSSQLHPDEAGHYFALDEKHAQDYADPHMYEVNIKADPQQFLDYGSLSPVQQANLERNEEVQRLRDSGVPGIRFPDRRVLVFHDHLIDVLRKYEFTPRRRA
jgi:hypothetical protein